MLARCGRLRWGWGPAFGLALILLVGDKAAWAQSSGESSARARNPHWSATGCGLCHQGGAAPAAGFTPTQVEELCTACHDGKRAVKSAHPSLRKIDGDQFRRPEGWPLVNGLVGCLTCHDVAVGCRNDVTRPARNSVFLRGYDGLDLRAFCNNCHVRAQVRRFNPHDMISPDGRFIAERCTFCHVGVPKSEPDGEPNPQAVGLRYDDVTLCMTCHTRHVDYFEPGHLGARVTSERKAHMVAFERAGSEQGVPEGAAPRRLPLKNGDVVVCWTCHNPHATGVFAPGTVQAHGGFEPGGAPLDRGLRYGPSEICRACHDK
jgi:predicted CXXCH cytochrome family protein